MKRSEREGFNEIKGIWYNQSYEEALDLFKGMSREKILEICKTKEDSYNMDLERWDPDGNNTFDDNFRLILNCVEAKAYRKASRVILNMGSIN